jgi:16S rRNA (guanine(1405)-N(7))-methyltransferase
MKKTKKSIYYYLRQYKQEEPEKVQEKFSELKEKLKKEKKLEKTISLHKELLKMHISSKERIPFYSKFYEKIFKVTGIPESILDVSCGFNYFSVPFMKFNGFYAGTEHKKEFVNKINEYFFLIEEFSEIKGKGFLLDLKEKDFDSRNELLELNKGKLFDVAFVLKLIPVMEREKKGLTENLIELIPAKWIVLSCSKESMTKKEDISFRETFLINKFIKENSLYLSSRIDFDNEIVFVVKRE